MCEYRVPPPPPIARIRALGAYLLARSRRRGQAPGTELEGDVRYLDPCGTSRAISSHRTYHGTCYGPSRGTAPRMFDI